MTKTGPCNLTLNGSTAYLKDERERMHPQDPQSNETFNIAFQTVVPTTRLLKMCLSPYTISK